MEPARSVLRQGNRGRQQKFHAADTGPIPGRKALAIASRLVDDTLDLSGSGSETGVVAGSDEIEDLVRRYHRRLVSLAYALCGDGAEAEDIVAEAYARSWPRLARGQVDDPAAYLRRAVVNGVSSWRRHRFVVRREELRRRVAPIGVGGEDQVATRDEVWQALQTLPLAQRQVVALRFIEDLSEAETAACLGVPAGTVKSRTARALIALRQAVHEEEDV